MTPMITIPNELTPIIKVLLDNNVRPIIVGGFVRDALLQIPSKDIDIEMYGIDTLEQLKTLLVPFGNVNEVGKSFGVLKLALNGLDIDFSLPRTEIKTAAGHKGFDVKTHTDIAFKEASLRRDFTINAMGFDIGSLRLLDPYNGQDDLKNRTLRCVNPETFIEDPLRVLRAVQFAARYELTMDDQLIQLCKKMVAQKAIDQLPKERIFEEIKKLLLKAAHPSIGFELMAKIGLLDYFPELKALQGVKQEPSYHPEGDVWIHTLLCLDAMASLRSGNERDNLILMLGILCHDLGKPATTKMMDGRIRAIGHETAGLEPTQTLLTRLSDEQRLIDAVLPLVQHHLKPLQFYKQKAKSSAVRRLAAQVNLDKLILIAKADFLGRTTDEAQEGFFPAGEWLKEKADGLNVLTHAPKALLQGRDLIKLGLTPSKQFKTILQTAFEAQLEGIYQNSEEAQLWLHNYLERSDFGKS